MEQRVLELLGQTQAGGGTKAAESQLRDLYTNDAFPGALVTIGSHSDVPVNTRQAALIQLRNLVNVSWSPSQEDFAGQVLLDDETKQGLRERLLSIIFDGNTDSRVTSQAAVVISKIAKSDFPEEWPTLLETLLGHVSQGNDGQVHGILLVLSEMISSAFDEEQFYNTAARIIDSLRSIAVDANRQLLTRAHAVNVFRSCFDFVENLKEKDEESITTFVRNVCGSWASFFLDVMKESMPQFPTAEEEMAGSPISLAWRGIVALKVQVVLTLTRIQATFPEMMPAQELFNVCWHAVQAHAGPYYEAYVDGDRQGALIGAYDLHYTIDFLVMEQIDYMQTLMEAPEVKQQLDSMLTQDNAANGTSVRQWLFPLIDTLVTFSCITREAEEMWHIDYNIFLTEESFAESANSPRTVCAGFVYKICEWYPKQTLECLVESVQSTFRDQNFNWRRKEAIAYNLQQVAEEYEQASRIAEPGLINICVDFARPIMNDNEDFLRARAHVLMAAMSSAWLKGANKNDELVYGCAQQSLHAIETDQSDIVKTGCIRIMRDYLTVLPSDNCTALQPGIVTGIAKFLEAQHFDPIDEYAELVDTVLETLRDTVMANPVSAIDNNALAVILTMVKYGAGRDAHSSILIDEAFTSAAETMAAEGPDPYAHLCQKVLPSLLAAFDVEDPANKQQTSLTDVAVSILRIIAESARSPLPQGFISAAMPRLCRIIFADVDFYLRQSATLTIKAMVDNDKDQVFTYVDPQLHKNGLDMCFLVIGHLLGPAMDDASAAEVGELAASIVEKAGADALGSTMHELLQILANRLSTAEHLGLVQSLVMVFARLAVFNAADVVSFLANLPVAGSDALNVVMQKWLENSVHFVGFEAIGQNMHALVSIFKLNDPRVEAITVQGDLIDDTSSRIRTRSQAKSRPIQHTQVNVPMKIVKLIVAELIPYNDTVAPLKSPNMVSQPMRRRNSNDSWESDDSGNGFGERVADDSTQRYLVEFLQSEGGDVRFQGLFAQLTDQEKERAMKAVEGYNVMQAQRVQLSAVPGR